MNVIFLDVDGVLRNNNDILKSLKYYIKGFNIPCISKEKMEILSFICNKFNCKVVLSSSWKLHNKYYDIDKEEFVYNKDYLHLLNLFKKYNIDFIGCTPNIKHGTQDMWKEYDIRIYLHNHKNIKHFCIIDDESYDLFKLKEYLVSINPEEGLSYDNLNSISKVLTIRNKYQNK